MGSILSKFWLHSSKLMLSERMDGRMFINKKIPKVIVTDAMKLN